MDFIVVNAWWNWNKEKLKSQQNTNKLTVYIDYAMAFESEEGGFQHEQTHLNIASACVKWLEWIKAQ